MLTLDATFPGSLSRQRLRLSGAKVVIFLFSDKYFGGFLCLIDGFLLILHKQLTL